MANGRKAADAEPAVCETRDSSFPASERAGAGFIDVLSSLNRPCEQVFCQPHPKARTRGASQTLLCSRTTQFYVVPSTAAGICLGELHVPALDGALGRRRCAWFRELKEIPSVVGFSRWCIGLSMSGFIHAPVRCIHKAQYGHENPFYGEVGS